jgi:glycosyltransferase involved in cell wall biosynthesis
MAASPIPLVSVIIPVFNGEAFLADAIRSVLAQTYQHFELTIANNCSTDRTLAIAEEFAARDARVRVHSYPRHVSVVESFNTAFTLMPDGATYCKPLGADDWLFPTCLAELVRVAEAHPTVGMVTSYVLRGNRLGGGGLPYPSTLISGREVCRLRLLRGIKVFGGPSASLLRASIVRQRLPFYNPVDYHGDNTAYLELLQRHDFGFVHQVLSYTRRDEGSRTTAYLNRVHSFPAAEVDELSRFGRVYLTPEEHATRLREAWGVYYRLLGRSVLELRGREFWHYHLGVVKGMGYELSSLRIALAAVGQLLEALLNPLRTARGVVRRLRRSPASVTQPAQATTWSGPVTPLTS